MGLGCEAEAPRYRFGENLGELRFELYDDTVGIHPSKSVLEDPNNPFRHWPVGDATKFAIESSGGDVAAFYVWATLLARSPYGELQFYAAKELAEIYGSAQAPEEDLPMVREMAIAGYQAMLDYFPDAVTYDVTGTTAYELATPAFLAIQSLGGAVTGGWVLVTKPDGATVAVRGGGL
ncbi:hypothetical protein L6R52_12675 [Myxococcota bacterium]|nr:hypothetical protein [Myxococcota bacterium]